MTSATAQSKMDRAGLIAIVDQYYEALGARDPGRLPLAANVKFTENCQVIPLGTALWATTTSPGTYRIYFADSGGQQVGSYAVVEEMGAPAILALRLKVINGQITEIEHIVGRDAGTPSVPNLWDPAELRTADPIFEAVVEPSRRSPRDVLIAAARGYYDAIEQGDGHLVPVIDECVRRENGAYSALNPNRPGTSNEYSVFESIDMGYWTHLKVRDRRYPIVDEERCLSWSINFFETPGNVTTLNLKGKGPTPLSPRSLQPSALPVAELFKVIDGKIHRIETVLGPRLPFGSKSGWD
jgi:hypothetical protein